MYRELQINNEKKEALESVKEPLEKAAGMDHLLEWWLADVYALIGEKKKAIDYFHQRAGES